MITRVLRLIPVVVLVFVLGYCNPPAQAPAPSKPASPSGLNAGSSAPVNAPELPSLFMDSSKWYQEYVAAGGQPNPAWTAHPVTTKDCPILTGQTATNSPIWDAPGALCEMLPDHASGRYASYLLFPISATYSTTTADPTPHYFDASGYKSLTVKLRIIAGPNVQFMHDSEPNNDAAHGCPTPAHIRPFLAHQQGTLSNWTWRWFAHDHSGVQGIADTSAALLVPEDATIIVPLDQQHFVSVYPGKDPAAEKLGWETMIHNVSNFGLVLGGGCSYSHGVSVVNGPAELQVLSYELTK